MSTAEDVIRLFETQGQIAYFGEPVSVLEHSLQAAHLAQQAGSADALVVAALVHDIGHLLHGLDENIASQGIDGRHESIGEAWLRSRFGPEVTEPVRLHVDAKRYLCRVDPAYAGLLSESSITSLALQGGPYTDAEAKNFEANPWSRDAIALRRWDDSAKIPDMPVAPLNSYRERLEAVSNRP